jgi:hypothetical protein
MSLRWGIYLALLAAPALLAGTIDVSSDTSATLETGDSLAFQVLSSSFSTDAQSFGLPIYPTAISFALTTAPLVGAGDFQATLQSADGSISVAWANPIAFTGGSLQSFGYSGAVSTANGYLQLSPQLSVSLFSASPILTLTYTGPDVTLGLASYSLRQDMHVSLGGGPLTVGALQGSVTLETPESLVLTPLVLDLSGPRGPSFGGFTTDPAVPEPGSALLFVGGAALLGIFLMLGRRLRRTAAPIPCEKSTVCNR